MLCMPFAVRSTCMSCICRVAGPSHMPYATRSARNAASADAPYRTTAADMREQSTARKASPVMVLIMARPCFLRVIMLKEAACMVKTRSRDITSAWGSVGKPIA